MMRLYLYIFWLFYLLLCFALNTGAGTFRDDFENKDDFLADKRLRVGGVWGEDVGGYVWENGSIKGTAAVNLGFFQALITGDHSWTDYTVECKVMPLQILEGSIRSWIGLVLRRPCIDCDPGYYFILNGNSMAAIDSQNGILDSFPFDFKMDTWYFLKGVANGKHLEFYINDELVVELKSDINSKGKVGVIVFNSIALFDDFIMTGPEVIDGGHWNPEAHPDPKFVESIGKLAMNWGKIKRYSQ